MVNQTHLFRLILLNLSKIRVKPMNINIVQVFLYRSLQFLIYFYCNDSLKLLFYFPIKLGISICLWTITMSLKCSMTKGTVASPPIWNSHHLYMHRMLTTFGITFTMHMHFSGSFQGIVMHSRIPLRSFSQVHRAPIDLCPHSESVKSQ